MIAKLPRLALSLFVSGLAVGCRPARSEADGPQASESASTSGATAKEEEMKAKTSAPLFSKSGYDITPLAKEKIAELASKLDPQAQQVTQACGTEPAFTGKLLENKKDGAYVCAVCGLPLFSSDHKFNSGTGWPSFFREFDPQHVTRITDDSHGMSRTEIRCARCGAHLGHVFNDGPKPTGERHCLNSASLQFHDKGDMPAPEKESAKTETAFFAGGCFWGLEHYFQLGPGVIDAVSGYMQGKKENPTYQEVCGDATGHAESVKVVFDPNKITYRRLLEAFFEMHDATQLNRQGPDVGSQYRSGIWYANERQKREAEDFLKELQAKKSFTGRKIVTQVEPAKAFYAAEEYHQDYLEKTGGACHVSNPWSK